MPLILLPLISSAFTPVDSMPGWFQPIAEHQPFTPAAETLRGLLLGTEIGNSTGTLPHLIQGGVHRQRVGVRRLFVYEDSSGHAAPIHTERLPVICGKPLYGRGGPV